MDFTQIAKDAGCLDSATEDVTRRLEAHFQGETPTPEAVTQWLAGTLRPSAPHLWPAAPTLPPALAGHPAEMLAWAREHGLIPQRRRPLPIAAPPDIEGQWRDLPAAERMTKYRQWRDSQG